MEVMENGTQEEIETPQPESTENQQQDVADPTNEVEVEPKAEEPEIYLDNDGNLKFSDEILGIEPEIETVEAEPEKPTEQPEQDYTVKVDGEEIKVTLEELLNGYSRTKDYTQKTMKVAEERKEIEKQQAEVGEQLKQLEIQQRYGVPIPQEAQLGISTEADKILRQQMGDNVDELSQGYQDARSVVVNQLTSQYSDQVKASQRIEKAQQYLRQREPQFNEINQMALKIAENEMSVTQFNRLNQARLMGDPAPMLEVFDVAKKRLLTPQQPAQQPVQQPVKKTPEPPRTESSGGASTTQPRQPAFDTSSLSGMSPAQQTQALIDLGLI